MLHTIEKKNKSSSCSLHRVIVPGGTGQKTNTCRSVSGLIYCPPPGQRLNGKSNEPIPFLAWKGAKMFCSARHCRLWCMMTFDGWSCARSAPHTDVPYDCSYSGEQSFDVQQVSFNFKIKINVSKLFKVDTSVIYIFSCRTTHTTI